MNKVIRFLIEKVNVIVFLFLEIICFILIYSNNPYQGAAFFNSSNSVVASIADGASQVKEYLHLREVNNELLDENAKLRYLLTKKNLMDDVSFRIANDTEYVKKYQYVAAKVINNSTSNFHNYITINKGWADNIAPGMGVICFEGIVGKVKSCSKNFATITSILHTDMLISSKLKRSNAVGSLKWEGIDAGVSKLMFVPRHIQVNKGDTILTSEFNSVFPEKEMIGVVKNIKIKGDENFYNIDVKLSTDFSKLTYVYVIKNKLAFQQDSLENLNTLEKNENK